MAPTKLQRAWTPARLAAKPLLPWQREFAAWLASQSRMPSRPIQREQCCVLAGQRVSVHALKMLRARPDFEILYKDYQINHIRRVKERLERKLDKYERAHEWALTKAQEADDYKTVGAMAGKVLEKSLWNEAGRDDAAKVAVTINLTGSRIANLDSDIPEVEFEEITEDEEEGYS